jgi:sulfite reductase (ferredoxin)
MTIAEINAALLTKLAACGDVVRTVTTVPAPIRDMVHRRLEDDARRLSTHLLPRTRAYHEIWLDGEPRREEESAADEPDSAHGDDPQQPEHLSAAAAPVAFIEAEQRLEGAAAVVRLHCDPGGRSDRRRLKYVIAEHGEEWARERLRNISADSSNPAAKCPPSGFPIP